MVTVQQIRLGFQVEREGFARELYGGWDRFFRLGVEEVADRVFSVYDSSDEVIRVGCLEVDLGVFEEEDFYGSFPRVMEERLEEVFAEVLRHRERYDVRIVSLHRDGLEVLMAFLFDGFFPVEVAEEFRDLHRLLREVLEREGYRLGRGLKRYGAYAGMRKRLVRQFTDRELERLVEVTEPSEAAFVKVYTCSLIASWHRLDRTEISSGDYRNVVWEVVWAYLLCEARGFFSRKQLVKQTVVELASYFNLEYWYLLDLLTKGLKRMVAGWLVLPELSVILSEMRREELDWRKEERLEVVESGGVEKMDVERLRCLLSEPESCRRLLEPMREKEIYRLAEVVMLSESSFVILYAQVLEREKERGMLEGRAGPEFRILKWEFLFAVMLSFPAQAFQRKVFVWKVISRIAVHYNVDVRTLLLFLCGEQIGVPEMLRVVLQELYEEQLFVVPVRLAEALVYRALSVTELERLRYTLLHPQLGRRLLQALPEEEIYRLVRAVVFSESGFVVSYARVLDREQRRGMLEGRQEKEFRVLKWEFIFAVVLNAPASIFSRKQFVRAVLQQIAAHYNLTVAGLLDYFSVVFGKGGTESSPGVWEVLLALREEEQPIGGITDAEQVVGVRLQEPGHLTEVVWKEFLEGGDAELVEGLLEGLPCWIRRRMKVLTEAEEVSLKRMLKMRPMLQRKWLECIGTPALRQILTELEQLEREGYVRGVWLWEEWLQVCRMAEILSREELLYFVLRGLGGSWRQDQTGVIYERVWSYPQQFPGWADLLSELFPGVCRVVEERKKRKGLKGDFMMKEEKEFFFGSGEGANEACKAVSGEERFYVSNAGMVILAPYFLRLFERLEWTEKGIFKDERMKVRAVFAMQYLVFGLTEFPETELVLNKLLADWRREDVLPLSTEFSEGEKEVFDSLLKGAKAHWNVMEHTSADGFRGSFLIRNGVLADTGDIWQLTVEEKSYDVLLGSLPWTISPVKFPWMKKPLYVNWH